MAKFLLDTNAYFALLEYIGNQKQNDVLEEVLKGECYISRLTQIEIVAVIGKHARGASRQIQMCNRMHEDTRLKCGKKFYEPEKKRWSPSKTHAWIKLEKEISEGRNSLMRVNVLEVDEKVVAEAQSFIQKALTYNFKSMDAMILGTAKAYSEEAEEMVIVTADKGLKAGMTAIGHSFLSV